MADLFDTLFPDDASYRPSAHEFGFALIDHATSGVTLNQIKNKLVSVYGMDSTGENQMDAISTDILGDADPLARAMVYNAVLHMRSSGWLYETNDEIKTRLGF